MRRRGEAGQMSDEQTLTPAIATVTKMLEPLSEAVQERVVEHLREYLLDMEDEAEWSALVHRTQPQLIEVAQRAPRQIAEGLAKPLDLDQLLRNSSQPE
jgi:hypothetical protein